MESALALEEGPLALRNATLALGQGTGNIREFEVLFPYLEIKFG